MSEAANAGVPWLMAILRNRLHWLLIAPLVIAGCGASPSTSSTTTATAIPAVAPGRGIWFWESAAQQNIVATPSAQLQAIANFKAWNVTSVYGSYASQIASNPAAVRAWNANLAANGIASYTLASNGNFFLPEQWSATQSWLQTNFLGFNAASKPGEGFVGVAFDVEPGSFTGTSTEVSWNATTPAGRRAYLTDFTDMLQSARAFLNANGASGAPIQTYLVNWFSTLNLASAGQALPTAINGLRYSQLSVTASLSKSTKPAPPRTSSTPSKPTMRCSPINLASPSTQPTPSGPRPPSSGRTSASSNRKPTPSSTLKTTTPPQIHSHPPDTP